MERIVLKTPGSVSEIVIGESWESVRQMLPQEGVIIITDENVGNIYGKRFPEFPVITINAGEESKKIEVIGHLAGRLIGEGIDRSGFILGIGGGVVCDITGFLSSIYMRGIRCGYVSTTLLSQVDASTGGKNGINIGNAKNILGCFKQPEFVICDPAMLQSLGDEEYFSGLAELIKTGIIGHERLFEAIEHNYEGIINRDPELLSVLISMAVSFKASVVSEDEKESGIRRILNFGHSFGHAIELWCSFGHGYAVASGMELASKFSFQNGFISGSEYERIIKILNTYKLLRNYSVPDDRMAQLIMSDKKKAGDSIHFVFTRGIGKAEVEKIPVGEILSFYHDEINHIKQVRK